MSGVDPTMAELGPRLARILSPVIPGQREALPQTVRPASQRLSSEKEEMAVTAEASAPADSSAVSEAPALDKSVQPAIERHVLTPPPPAPPAVDDKVQSRPPQVSSEELHPRSAAPDPLPSGDEAAPVQPPSLTRSKEEQRQNQPIDRMVRFATPDRVERIVMPDPAEMPDRKPVSTHADAAERPASVQATEVPRSRVDGRAGPAPHPQQHGSTDPEKRRPTAEGKTPAEPSDAIRPVAQDLGDDQLPTPISAPEPALANESQPSAPVPDPAPPVPVVEAKPAATAPVAAPASPRPGPEAETAPRPTQQPTPPAVRIEVGSVNISIQSPKSAPARLKTARRAPMAHAIPLPGFGEG